MSVPVFAQYDPDLGANTATLVSKVGGVDTAVGNGAASGLTSQQVSGIQALVSGAGFASRAAFVSSTATTSFFPNQVVSVGGNVYRYIGTGTAISDLPGWIPDSTPNLNHWRTDTSAAAGDAAMTQAIAYINANGGALKFPTGTVYINSVPPAITGTGWDIYMEGTTLAFYVNGSGSNGTFFTIGATGVNSRYGCIHGGILQCNNTPDQNAPALNFVNATQVDTENTTLNNVAAIVFLGDPNSTAKATRCNIDLGGDGNCNNGLNSDANIRVYGQSSCSIRGTISGGGGPCNTNATGKMVHIAPVAGSLSDGLDLSQLRMQMFSVSVPGGGSQGDGKPYGIYCDATNAAIVNTTINTAVMDHTTVCGLYFTDGPSSTAACRFLHINDLRMASDNGMVIKLFKQSAITTIWDSFIFSTCFGEITDPNSGVEITGVGYTNCVFQANNILDTTTTTKLRAVLANSDGWSFAGNTFGPNTAAATGIQCGIEVSNPAITDILIASNNHYNAAIPTQVKEPDVYTTGIAPNRRIDGPSKVAYAAFLIPIATEYIYTVGRLGTGATGTQAGAADRMDLFPWKCEAEFTSDQIAVIVTIGVVSAQGKVLVRASDSNGRPAALIFETAAMDFSAAGTVTVSIPSPGTYTFKRGLTYWIGVRHSSVATLATWALGATPELNGGTFASGSRFRILRQTLAFATAAPASYTYSSGNLQTPNPIAVALRVAN